MPSPQDAQHRLNRLRAFRNRAEPDLSLKFLAEQFKRDILRPYQQLHAITALWQHHVPDPLRQHTRLVSLQRGTLRVSVDSSAHLFELDRLLRTGLFNQLIREHKGPALRKVKLEVSNPDPF